MNPVVFGMALATVLSLTVALTVAGPHDLHQFAGAASGWVVLLAMIWSRWVGRPAAWLWRLAAAVGALILAGLIHRWWPLDDVFVIYGRNCAPRMGTFWPLVFVWLGGAALQTFAIRGGGIRAMRSAPASGWRRAVWLLLLLAWTLACGYVFVRNINPVAWRLSLLGVAKVIGFLLAALAVFVLPIAWLSRSNRKARRAIQADYEAIDEATRRALLTTIDRHARTGAFRLIYRRADDAIAATALAQIGGSPLGRPTEAWPVDDEGVPGVFLLQLPLAGIGAPVWESRLLVVYLMQNEVLVRSHADSNGLEPRQAPSDDVDVSPATLQPLALPLPTNAADVEASDEDEDGLGADWLIDAVPGLREKLVGLTTHPVGVLRMLLVGDDADMAQAILVGGTPELIQNAHDPHCELCGQPMRFLMQFGDVTESMAMGDCGVGYVYGCDAHPEHCQAFVDCY